MPKTIAKKSETITIPMHLAKLLAAEPEDIKYDNYEEVQAVAKSLLRVLIESSK